MNGIIGLLFWIYLLGIVPMRLWLPRQTTSHANPWLITFAWPILMGVKVVPQLMSMVQQHGRSASLSDQAPTPLGYVDATSIRREVPSAQGMPPAPPADFTL